MSPWCDEENAVRGGRRFPGDASALPAVPGALVPAEGGVPTAFEGPGPAQKTSRKAQRMHSGTLPMLGMPLLVGVRMPALARQPHSKQVASQTVLTTAGGLRHSSDEALAVALWTCLLLGPSADGVGTAGLPASPTSSAEDAKEQAGLVRALQSESHEGAQKAVVGGRCCTCAHVLLWRRSLIHGLRLILAALGQHGEVLADL